LPVADPTLAAFIRERTGNVAADKRFVYWLLAATGICVVPLSGFMSDLPGFRFTLLEHDDEKRAKIYKTIAEAAEAYVTEAERQKSALGGRETPQAPLAARRLAAARRPCRGGTHAFRGLFLRAHPWTRLGRTAADGDVAPPFPILELRGPFRYHWVVFYLFQRSLPWKYLPSRSAYAYEPKLPTILPRPSTASPSSSAPPPSPSPTRRSSRPFQNTYGKPIAKFAAGKNENAGKKLTVASSSPAGRPREATTSSPASSTASRKGTRPPSFWVSWAARRGSSRTRRRNHRKMMNEYRNTAASI
jgi:hypothetical protein